MAEPESSASPRTDRENNVMTTTVRARPIAGAIAREPARPRLTVRSALDWAFILALAALFIAFRPPNLGGSTNYMFITGSSMQPTMYTGDLAILRPADSYAIGDVVAYAPSQAPDRLIIHRIVGGDAASGFVLRGDNRETDDLDRPTADKLVGRAAVTIPKIGWVIDTMRNPLILALIAAVLLVGVFWDRLPPVKAYRAAIDSARREPGEPTGAEDRPQA